MPETPPNPEKSRQSKEIYLEIGPGLDPSAIRGTDRYEGNKVYLGIDLASDNSRTYTPDRDYGDEVKTQFPQMQKEVQRQSPNENILFAHGEGQKLPLTDESVKEIYIANVLTAPQNDDNRSQLLAEMNRVLTTDGEVIVKVDWDDEAWDKDQVSDILASGGFEPYKHISSTDDPLEYQQWEARRGKSQLRNESKGYFLLAHKIHQSSTNPLARG